MLAHFLGYFSMRSAADSLSDQSQDLIGSKRKDAEHQMAHHLGVASHSNRPPNSSFNRAFTRSTVVRSR
jgi:hypothetical protein